MILKGAFSQSWRGCKAICRMRFLLCQSYPAFKILLLKSDTATRAKVSSLLVVRLNNNNESCIIEFQPRCSEPYSKILCMSKFRLGKQLAGLEVFTATPAKSIWKRRWRR